MCAVLSLCAWFLCNATPTPTFQDWLVSLWTHSAPLRLAHLAGHLTGMMVGVYRKAREVIRVCKKTEGDKRFRRSCGDRADPELPVDSESR